MIAIAQWLAPAATMVAALMTAANLGARLTGWGFVVFTVGSICWAVIGASTGQTGLLATNVFLTFVNLVGVWRWLGRQARYESVGAAAEAAGRTPQRASVVPATGIVGRKISDDSGTPIAEAVEAIVDCETGKVRHLVVRFGGISGVGETIVALPLADICLTSDAITTRLSAEELTTLSPVEDNEWQNLLRR